MPRPRLITHLVHSNNSVHIDLGRRGSRVLRVISVVGGLLAQPFQHLLLHSGISDGIINALPIFILDKLDKAVCLLPELGLGNEFAVMDAARQSLQARNVVHCRRAKVLSGLFLLTVDLSTNMRKNVVDIDILQSLVDIDIVGMKDGRVIQGLEDGLKKGLGEEGVLVWGLIAAHARVDLLLFAEKPVEEAKRAVRYWDCAGNVDRPVERELDAFDEVDGNGVLQAAANLS